MKRKYVDELVRSMAEMRVIDTHEHLALEESLRVHHDDVLQEYLTHYFSSDLISAGLPKEEMDRVKSDRLSLHEKWDLLEPFWERCRHTGYGQVIDRSMRLVYGIDGMSRSTIDEINAGFHASFAEQHYQHILKELCGIECSYVDNPDATDLDEATIADEAFFIAALRVNRLVMPEDGSQIRSLARDTNVDIASFDDYLEACRRFLIKGLERTPVLKISLAYERSLAFGKPDRSMAEQEFIEMAGEGRCCFEQTQPLCPGEKFQDYLLHFILEFANERGLCVQIHTGIQEGNANLIDNSDPALLSPLFIMYPDVRFDLFHIGYPYHDKIGALAKMFPNVFIDMCWAHIITPPVCRRVLGDWLESVPYNKISAFGGDYFIIDLVPGHLQMARENIAEALAVKIEEGLFSYEKAEQIARAMFFDNPASIFGYRPGSLMW